MEEWQRRFWKTTASAYIGVVIRLLLGLVLFRTMYQEFSHEQFGFWALLWSLFGYGVLLDFGFGFTAQKAVAEKTATRDMVGLSRLLATILWTFIGMAAVLLLVFLNIRESFMIQMDVPVMHREEFGRAYIVFFIGLAVMFPLGIFPEILRGLQRLDLANWVSTFSTIFNFGMLYWGLKANWDMAFLMGVSVVTSILPNLVAAVLAIRRLPTVSFSPALFEWRAVKAQMGFSITAYLITFSNMLLAKSDQLVISMTLGVASVAIYQAGYKMGEMLGIFSMQLQLALSPAAASLHARGDEAGLRNLLLRSSRLTFLIVTPCYLLSAVYIEPLIRLLTGDPVSNETWWIGHVLLFAIYSSQLTNGCSKRVLVMCGEESKLLWVSVIEALVNLILSLILARTMGVLGVAIGTLIPTVLIGWLWVLPITIRRLNLPFIHFIKYHLRGTVLPLVVFSGILAAIIYWIPASPTSGFIDLGWRAALCGIPLLYFSRNLLRSISKAE